MTVANSIKVDLLPEERAALAAIVQEETRTPRDVFRWLLVREARDRGLMPKPQTKHNGAEVRQDITGAAVLTVQA